MQLFERVVSTLAAASLVITLITTYLALNRTWGAKKIVEILSQVALIDDMLDDKERAYVEKFAQAWGIPLSWDAVLNERVPGDKVNFLKLRKNVSDFLATTPPRSQVLQLADV